MTKAYTLNGLKCVIFLCMFFAFSYCSVWGYQLFEHAIIEYIYAALVLISITFMLFQNQLKLGALGIIMVLCLLVMLWRRASVTYLLFYVSLLFVLLVGIKADHMDFISKLINFFVWLQLIGMVIGWLFPQLYVRFFLPSFEGLDYYDRLQSAVLARRASVGFTTQQSHFAGFMALGMGNRIFLYHDGKPFSKQRMWLFVALAMIGLYLSGKRAHFVFCLIALVVAFYLKGYLTRNNSSKTIRFLGIVLVCLIGFALLWGISLNVEGTFLNEIFDTFGNLGDEDIDITTGRTKFWDVAIQQFKENPIKGIGWKSFWHIEFYGRNYDVHNIYLQLLCEIGIIGAVLFYMVFLVALWKTFGIIKQKEIDVKYRKFALFSFFYQVFFLLYGITGNPLYDASFYIFYFLSIAFITSIPSVSVHKAEVSHENSNYNISPRI